MPRMKWFTIKYGILAYAIVPKNASETALSPTGQWFFDHVARADATISHHHGPRTRQNNLLPVTGGAETSRCDTQAGRRTHTLWAPVFSSAYRTVRVRTWSRSSSCGHCSALTVRVHRSRFRYDCMSTVRFDVFCDTYASFSRRQTVVIRYTPSARNGSHGIDQQPRYWYL